MLATFVPAYYVLKKMLCEGKNLSEILVFNSFFCWFRLLVNGMTFRFTFMPFRLLSKRPNTPLHGACAEYK
jgi:hypothetical protein